MMRLSVCILLLFLAFPLWAQDRPVLSVRPSYQAGYARSQAESAYSELWPGLLAAYAPPIGTSGTQLRDLVPNGGLRHGTFNGLTGASWVMGNDSRVPGWTLNFVGTTNEFVNLGDIIDFRFLSSERWSVIVRFLVDNSTGDDRALVSKWAVADATRQFLLRTDAQAAPTNIEIYLNNVPVDIDGASVVQLNTWYTVLVENDGTGAAGGLSYRIYDDSGTTLDSGTGTHSTNSSDLTEPIHIGGPTDLDPYSGRISFVYFYKGLAPMATFVPILIKDPLAPFRLKASNVGKAIAAAPAERRIIIIGKRLEEDH